jgi:hypothetical protein
MAVVTADRSTKHTVTIWMIGGLGNQMFQYAASKTLANALDVPLRICTFDYRRPGRPYLLSKLSIAETAEDFDPLFKRAPARLTKNPTAFKAFNQGAQWGLWPTLYREKSADFDPGFFRLRAPVELRGYFPSERYFVAERSAIMRWFQPSEALSPPAQRCLEQIRAAELPVAVHIRGGDFLTPGSPPMLDQRYYGDAFARIEAAANGRATYFLFTDDLPHARKTLPPDRRFNAFEPVDDRPWEDMHLMAQCAHNIVANSSFSWWGAWLNPRSDKIVIAPNGLLPGSGVARDTPDLYPPDWISINA